MFNFFYKQKIDKHEEDAEGVTSIMASIVSTALILNMPYAFQMVIISYILGTNNSFQNATKDLLKLKNT